jgi:hypothetical protein
MQNTISKLQSYNYYVRYGVSWNLIQIDNLMFSFIVLPFPHTLIRHLTVKYKSSPRCSYVNRNANANELLRCIKLDNT